MLLSSYSVKVKEFRVYAHESMLNRCRGEWAAIDSLRVSILTVGLRNFMMSPIETKALLIAQIKDNVRMRLNGKAQEVLIWPNLEDQSWAPATNCPYMGVGNHSLSLREPVRTLLYHQQLT